MIRRLWLKLFRRRHLEQDLAAEMAFHREMARAAGNPVPFGNRSVFEEQALDLWRFTWLENLWRDLRFAARGLMRSPVLLVGALASLGLGIGANTTLFSLATEFLLSEPSVSDAASIVSVRVGGNSHSEYDVVRFVQRSGIFAEVTGEQMQAYVNWNDGAETRRLYSTVTAKNFFTTLGVPLALGRGYNESDPDEVVVLHHHFWRTRFAADPSIVGRAINLQGKAYTVVGVLRENHRTLTGFGFAPDVYAPYYSKTGHLAIYARLKPGQSREAARAAVQAVGARLDIEHPQPYLKYAQNCEVEPISGLGRLLREQSLMTVSVFFAVLLAIAGLVLLIACVNVASLLLARAAARRREIAIRVSVGAGRARLLQQLLVESLLLALLGTGFGLAVARVTTTLLASIPLPMPVPIRLVIEPDWRVALYAAFLAAFATLACGLLPALQSVKESMTHDLQREPRQRLRRMLVGVQIAVSLVVLVTGFLFLRNMLNSGAANPGFDIKNTIRAEVSLPPAPREGYLDEGLRVLAALPGIESVAAVRIVPFADAATRGSEIEFPDNGEKVRMRSYFNLVTPDYFRTMSIPLMAGRTFLPSDRGGPKVVVVNRVFAQRYLGKRTPIGTVFNWGAEGKTPYQIVGVVEGTKNLTLGEVDEPQFYEPLRKSDTRVQFILRSAVTPATQLAAVRQALHRLDPAAGAEVQTLYSAIGLAFLPSQVGAALMGAIGLLGLLLAAVGLYGTLVYSVARRRPEIAVRMAIGASRSDVARMVMMDSLKLIGWGSACGLFIAFFITKPLAMFLVPSVKPGDPFTFIAVAVVFLLVGVLAAVGPSRQAAATDPVSAVRQGF
jgi:predicted permease